MTDTPHKKHDREVLSDIEKKYFSKTQKARMVPLREPLKQNLQPDIGKIDGIIRKISEKEAPRSELIRLRGTVQRLISSIDHQLGIND